MLVWPNRAGVDAAVRHWANNEAPRHAGVRRLGYFGSYARDDWGVGSDLDLIAIVDACDEPRGRRALRWDLSVLPVPAEILVYTQKEWSDLAAARGRFWRTVDREAVWLLP